LRLSRRSFLFGAGAVAALGTAGGALAQRPQAFEAATPIRVTAKPIDRFSVTDPDRSRFGSLIFRSGLELQSPVSAFGGFSGLWRSPKGDEIIALADNAQWLKARLKFADGRLSGLADPVMAPLLLSGGKPLRRSRFYDTESLAIAGNTAFVGVERNHAVIRFPLGRDGSFLPGGPISAPAALQELPSNGGLEAIGVAPQRSPLAGALVAIAENAGGDTTTGFILTGSRRGSFTVVIRDGYGVSDLAFLPDGDLLLLERRFSLLGGFRTRLRRVEAAALKAGARIDGPILFESDAAQQIDNMEGLAVHREGNETILTLISDDNFNALQRTLLLEFSLVD
jgi:hypothetical protein